MKKTWFTLRMDDTGLPNLIAYGAEDITDSSGVVHTVTYGVDVPVPAEAIAALTTAVEAAKPDVEKGLRRSAAKTLTAVEVVLDRRASAKAKAVSSVAADAAVATTGGEEQAAK